MEFPLLVSTGTGNVETIASPRKTHLMDIRLYLKRGWAVNNRIRLMSWDVLVI
jgi:hypothetical protein